MRGTVGLLVGGRSVAKQANNACRNRYRPLTFPFGEAPASVAEPEDFEVHMEMLTIGAFARATRLSPKALRLYDELELLRPARVDPDTGYRYYAVEQLERARLVAWLRRLGMPLAGIREVCALEPAAAAREIRAYWARVETETAVRRDLAAFLVHHLQTE